MVGNVVGKTINRGRKQSSKDKIPPGASALWLITENGVIDYIGESARTIYPLQYIQGPVDLTHADLTPTCVGTKEGTATWDRTVAGKFQIDSGTIWSFEITFDDTTTSTYEFGTALSATTGVVFDTSGYGRHLLFTVSDTTVTCATSLVNGSDYLNQEGWTIADGSQYDEFASLILLGTAIPSGSGFIWETI